MLGGKQLLVCEIGSQSYKGNLVSKGYWYTFFDGALLQNWSNCCIIMIYDEVKHNKGIWDKFILFQDYIYFIG